MSPSLIYWFLTNKLATQQVFFACNRSSINFNAFIRSWCWTQFIYQVSKLLAPVIYFAKTFKFNSVCRIKDCSKLFSNTLFRLVQIFMRKIFTLFESENERQKIEPVPIPLPRNSRNFPDVKTRNVFFFHNWTSEIIPFIHFGMQMDRT